MKLIQSYRCDIRKNSIPDYYKSRFADVSLARQVCSPRPSINSLARPCLSLLLSRARCRLRQRQQPVRFRRNYQLPFLQACVVRTHNNVRYTMEQCLQCKQEPLKNLNSIPGTGVLRYTRAETSAPTRFNLRLVT